MTADERIAHLRALIESDPSVSPETSLKWFLEEFRSAARKSSEGTSLESLIDQTTDQLEVRGPRLIRSWRP